MPDRDDEFFVGYLPTPAETRRFTRNSAVAMSVLILITAGVIATLQRDPGNGNWNQADGQRFSGVVSLSPYPSLRSGDRDLMLVTEGKHGAAEIATPLDGQSVTIKGQLLERGPLGVIEVHDITGIGKRDSATKSDTEPLDTLLRGEIIDPKCYAGAMKPGDGKPHKACATLCIRGGIPPMFRAVAEDGTVTLYQLADAEGKPLSGDKLEAVLPFVADRVELYGTIERRGAALVLRLEPGSILRL